MNTIHDSSCHNQKSVFNFFFIFNQFQAERFDGFRRHAWVMSGLLDEDPERDRFLHPVQYCYDNVSEECSINLCAEDGFINCAHCPLTLCFNHFFIGNHFHGDDDI